MYVNNAAVMIKRIRDLLLLRIFGGFFAFAVLLFLMTVFDIQGLRYGIGYSTAFLIISFIPVFFILRSRKKLSGVEKYDSFFKEDHDGVITMDTLAKMLGVTPEKAAKDVDWLYRKGCFQQLTFDRSTGTITVSDKTKTGFRNYEETFVVKVCPTCGARVRLRKGGGDRCASCGYYVKDIEEVR